MNTKALNINQAAQNRETIVPQWNWLYTLGGMAALTAMLINLVDVVLGFGGTDVIASGSRSAADWFDIYQKAPFDGLYSLGIFNILYMAAIVPVYFALLWTHRRSHGAQATLVVVVFLLAMSIYYLRMLRYPC